ncbi:MAG: hypothetical protein AMJ93_11870 [Anaerolineae bacterium SM23_84]|nr:MAG: hypothetical protein AMJ93_11870 [Anaerolineae bacterium SM23_84]
MAIVSDPSVRSGAFNKQGDLFLTVPSAQGISELRMCWRPLHRVKLIKVHLLNCSIAGFSLAENDSWAIVC